MFNIFIHLVFRELFAPFVVVRRIGYLEKLKKTSPRLHVQVGKETGLKPK